VVEGLRFVVPLCVYVGDLGLVWVAVLGGCVVTNRWQCQVKVCVRDLRVVRGALRGT
jgi:hypothetical protein